MDDLEFEPMVNSFYEPLYRFALTLTQSEADACDLTQDTFYTFATKGNQLRDKTKLKSWLFTTLHRKFLGIRRHDTRFPHFEVGAMDGSLPTISPTMVNEMDAATVVAALREIDELYRVPLALHYLEDHSYRDIAEILEIPLGTVMSRLSRGKMLLRERLTSKAQPAAAKIIALEQPQRLLP